MELSEKAKERILNILGILFLIWGILAIVNSIFLGNPDQIFWNCYIGLLLIGIGIIRRNPILIGSQLTILAIPLLVWDIDFLYYFIFNNSLWGITDYIFVEQRLALSQIISLQHLFTLPFSLFTLYLLKTDKFDFWKVSIPQITLIFFVVFLTTPPGQNINCVFENCLSINPSIISNVQYQVIWFFVFFGMIIITNLILWRLPFLKQKKRRKKKK